jgi:protoheme IX farnesyltransferase
MNHTQDNLIQERSIKAVISDYFQLTKPGIALAVLMSMLMGFIIGSQGNVDVLLMLHAILGTFLIASGTSAHNMFMERNLDGLMKRTEQRPLPQQRISAQNGMLFSLFLIFTGLAYLVVVVNPVAGLVSFATTLIYLAAYTPLKRISAFNILVGAVPGALPPVGGWAAASGNISDPGMWLLFGIVLLWQIPHVMAIAWKYKDDYHSAGFKMLPKNDTTGTKTAFYAIACTLLLFPVSFSIFQFNIGGMLFLSLSIGLAVFYLWFGIKFAQERSLTNARKLMFASIAYLPLFWVVLFLDRVLF